MAKHIESLAKRRDKINTDNFKGQVVRDLIAFGVAAKSRQPTFDRFECCREDRFIDDLGSAHSISDAVINTDRLSARYGLPPVTLAKLRWPVSVQSAVRSVWEGDTSLGRLVLRIIVIPGSGYLTNDKIELIDALMRSLGTGHHHVEPPSSRRTEPARRFKGKEIAGQNDIYFGMTGERCPGRLDRPGENLRTIALKLSIENSGG